jgi:hypothetical protein
MSEDESIILQLTLEKYYVQSGLDYTGLRLLPNRGHLLRYLSLTIVRNPKEPLKDINF